MPLEPFSLRREREAGYFDEDGNYVAYRDAEADDAWLRTLPRGKALLLETQEAACMQPCIMGLRLHTSLGHMVTRKLSKPQSLHMRLGWLAPTPRRNIHIPWTRQLSRLAVLAGQAPTLA